MVYVGTEPAQRALEECGISHLRNGKRRDDHYLRTGKPKWVLGA